MTILKNTKIDSKRYRTAAACGRGSFSRFSLVPVHMKTKIDNNHTSPISYLLCEEQNTVGIPFDACTALYFSSFTYIRLYILFSKYLLRSFRHFMSAFSFYTHLFLFFLLNIDFHLLPPYTPVRNRFMSKPCSILTFFY